MALTLKTPGVYTQEISLLPPSVAAVQTAIPAFIGYTEIAGETTLPTSDPDWLPIPVRISSMIDYVSIFGLADNQLGINATVVGTDIEVFGPDSSNNPKYLMYYSLQMYFGNGGGPCYIASVGTYSTDPIDKDELLKGLSAIGMQDEPTLLVFPDAKGLAEQEFYDVNKAAIEQCNNLKDRFTIIDTYTDDSIAPIINPISKLRAGINLASEYLKYSASYYPFLSTTIDYLYEDQDVVVNITDPNDYGAQAQAIANQISTGGLTSSILNLALFVDDTTPDLMDFKPELVSKTLSIRSGIKSSRVLIQKVISIGQMLVANAPLPLSSDYITLESTVLALQTWVTDDLEGREFSLLQATNVINGAPNETALNNAITTGTSSVYEVIGYTGDPLDIAVVVGINDLDNVSGDLIYDLIEAIDTVSPSPAPVITNLAAIKDTDNVVYNQIKAQISQLPLVLPPSSTMAGIYAKVDNSNGVWTSPANVGLNYVLKPTQIIDNAMQEDMNVTSSGKSVNAIRAFTGRGTLVWGARTMAGNDNEWRYISVRRLFNFIEESISEASEQFVFQPNTANTWVRVRGMIENFLVNQWKAGALAGAKAEQAFYVRVGLGETMTAQDILEGSMIIEIGLAAVRPAEFIVLKFSHKMQEA